jgi:c-di-GMP-binding flagellar brake protein YcgR
MTQPGAVDQLRRWPRHRIDVRLKVSVEGAGSGGSAFGRGNNLSHGGMGAYIPSAIPLGSTVLLEVSFPYSPIEVRVRAVVRNCEGFRYGLEFLDISAEARRVIEKTCMNS